MFIQTSIKIAEFLRPSEQNYIIVQTENKNNKFHGLTNADVCHKYSSNVHSNKLIKECHLIS